jgi:ABC-type transport system involved in multi-copper enzyme maturation permease subunit
VGFYNIRLDVERATSSLLTQREIYSFIFMAGMYVINFLTIAMSVLTSLNTLSGEVTSGTIQTLVSKPVRRWEVVFGKWLGFAVMLTLYLLLMAGGTLLVVWLTAGYAPSNALQGMLFLWLNALLMLSVSFFGGASFSTLANGVWAFGLFGVAFVGGWIEYVGSFIGNRLVVNVGIISSLIIPSEALWRRAAHTMESPLVSAVGFSPFTSASVPSDLMIGYAVLYAGVMLALAVRKFGQRDL